MDLDHQTPLDSQKVGFVILAVALLAPAGLTLATDFVILSELGVVALLWYVAYTPEYGMYILLSPFYNPSSFNRPEQVPFFIMISLVAFVPRFVFVYQITRRYNGLSTDRRTLILGIISESIFIVLFILNVFTILLSPRMWISLTIPIPKLFLSGFAMLKYRPAPEPAIPWRELDNSKEW